MDRKMTKSLASSLGKHSSGLERLKKAMKASKEDDTSIDPFDIDESNIEDNPEQVIDDDSGESEEEDVEID